MISSILELAYNLTLLVAFSVISGFIKQRRNHQPWATLLQGLLFGLAAVIGMMRPLVLGPGLIFDGRSVMISLCGLFFGPLAVSVAAGMALVYRTLLGGLGVYMGLLVIVSSALLGLAFHFLWTRRGRPLTAGRLWGLGLLVHGTMLLLMTALPAGSALEVLQRLGLPILLAYPLVTVLIGMVLTRQEAGLRSVEALRESEARNRALLSAIPDLIFTNQRDGEYLAVNTSDPGLLFVPPEAFLHRRPQDFFPRPLADRFLEAFAEALDLDEVRELQYSLPFDGEEKHFEARVSPCTQDTVVTIVRDVTERKREALALRNSRDLIAKAFSVSPDAFAITSLEEGVYIEINEGFTRMTGYTEAEVLGRSSWAGPNPLWADPRDRERLVVGLKGRGEVQDLEATFRGKDGRSFVGLMSAKVFEMNGAKNVLSITRDITERRQAELKHARLQAQLQQVQKMESLGSLAGGVAHDMNNVLGAILGMATASIAAQPPGSPTYRAFETITQAATRGGKMVKSLLSFARQSPAEEHELDMNAILREEVDLLERTILAKARLELDLAAGLRPIRGDAGALTHAFMNLCINAADAMEEEGTLTLRTRNVDNDWIEVMVEDTGAGMSQEVLGRAMDPFYTTKEVGKGTGLGLSMVYSTVKAHRGQMKILSEPGRGTRVMMRFPACEVPAQGPEARVEPQAGSSSAALRVLVVDDDELIQCTMQALLDMMGHAATVASCGEEALARLEGGFQPDVVILDMNMPGLGGAGTLPRLRALRPLTPVLLATGRVDQFASDLARAHPHVTLLSKPFSKEDLQRHLETLTRPPLSGDPVLP